jgi:hypothetical protein
MCAQKIYKELSRIFWDTPRQEEDNFDIRHKYIEPFLFTTQTDPCFYLLPKQILVYYLQQCNSKSKIQWVICVSWSVNMSHTYWSTYPTAYANEQSGFFRVLLKFRRESPRGKVLPSSSTWQRRYRHIDDRRWSSLLTSSRVADPTRASWAGSLLRQHRIVTGLAGGLLQWLGWLGDLLQGLGWASSLLRLLGSMVSRYIKTSVFERAAAYSHNDDELCAAALVVLPILWPSCCFWSSTKELKSKCQFIHHEEVLG